MVAAVWAAWPRGAWGLLGSRLAPWGAGLLSVFGGVPGVGLARGWRLGELVSSWFSGRGHRGVEPLLFDWSVDGY